MQNLLEELKTTLQSDERLVIDGKLVKNKIVELALAMDADLIGLLLKNVLLKKHFFADVGGTYVFDKVAFQSFVSNKQFLPDSYTAFKNKIGLTSDNEYLSESKGSGFVLAVQGLRVAGRANQRGAETQRNILE